MRVLIEPVTEYESFTEEMRAMCGKFEVSPEELGPLILEMMRVSGVPHGDVIVGTCPEWRGGGVRLQFYNDYVE